MVGRRDFITTREFFPHLFSGGIIEPIEKPTTSSRFTQSLIGFVASTSKILFHFTNGLWTFCITWGLTVGQRAQRVARAISLVLFVAMYGTAVAIMMAFRA